MNVLVLGTRVRRRAGPFHMRPSVQHAQAGYTRSPGLTHMLDAARRLTEGTLALLREHAHLLHAQLPPDLYGYLGDGTLEQYVRQDARAWADGEERWLRWRSVC